MLIYILIICFLIHLCYVVMQSRRARRVHNLAKQLDSTKLETWETSAKQLDT